MALERRRNGRIYCYSSKRDENGRVYKAYHGAGDHGLMVELERRKIARKRKEELRQRDEFIAALWHLESIARLAKQASRQAVYSTCLLAGYQRSKQYKWSRKDSNMNIPTLASREEKEPTASAADTLGHEVDSPKPAPKRPANSFWPESIEETIKLVMAGRRDLLGHLRSQIAEVPDLWRQVSDLTRVAVEGWARKISRGNVEFQESLILASMEERKQLLGETQTIMQRTAVDRFIISKICVAYFDLATSCADESTLHSKTGMAIEKRRLSAEHQLREATRQLAKIKIIQEEIAPDSPVSASIRLFDPKSSQGRQVA